MSPGPSFEANLSTEPNPEFEPVATRISVFSTVDLTIETSMAHLAIYTMRFSSATSSHPISSDLVEPPCPGFDSSLLPSGPALEATRGIWSSSSPRSPPPHQPGVAPSASSQPNPAATDGQPLAMAPPVVSPLLPLRFHRQAIFPSHQAWYFHQVQVSVAKTNALHPLVDYPLPENPLRSFHQHSQMQRPGWINPHNCPSKAIAPSFHHELIQHLQIFGQGQDALNRFLAP